MPASRARSAPDPRTGEQVRAEVELIDGADGARAPAELAAWCADRLAALKRPAEIAVVDRLPMTGSGKVMRSG